MGQQRVKIKDKGYIILGKNPQTSIESSNFKLINGIIENENTRVHLKFNEGSGITANDSTFNNNNATIFGNYNWLNNQSTCIVQCIY